jgi:putative ABC transport system ATP-binding protein
MTNPLIELDDVRLTLGEGEVRTEILKGISLRLDPGESLAILGPSGSGKSSLMAVVAGLERATSGTVRLLGQDASALGEDALARMRGRDIGIVLQSFQLLPTMTAIENVSVPLELARVPDARARAEAELVSVGLGHRLTHYPAQLSGGEQQRVAIARATAPRPKLLLADEPTGNLDTGTGGSIIDLLITHDAAVAARAGRRIELADGRAR